MTLRTKVIGRNQTDHGPWVPGTVAGKKFHYQLFGCDWESLHDNNNTPPAVWDGGDIITPNTNDWKKVSGDYQAWLLKQNHPATTGTTGDYPYNGMGRVELAKNMVNTGTDLEPVMVNQLTQDMFYKGAVGSRVPNTNTIFVIRYDYVLGEDITIPDNCVLDFDGGSIANASGNNYTIDFNDCIIEANYKVFDSVLPLQDSELWQEINPVWFGVVDDGVTDNVTELNYMLSFIGKIKYTEYTFRSNGKTRPIIRFKTTGLIKITQPITISQKCDILGYPTFYYTGSHTELDGAIIINNGHSGSTFEINVTSIIDGGTLDFSDGVKFGGICIRNFLYGTLRSKEIVGFYAGIILDGKSGSACPACLILNPRRIEYCLYGVLTNTINSAWINEIELYGCMFDGFDIASTNVPQDFTRGAFIKMLGDGSYENNSWSIHDNAIEQKVVVSGTPMPTDFLYYDIPNKCPMYFSFINNRIEEIGGYLLNSNAVPIGCSVWPGQFSSESINIRTLGNTYGASPLVGTYNIKDNYKDSVILDNLNLINNKKLFYFDFWTATVNQYVSGVPSVLIKLKSKEIIRGITIGNGIGSRVLFLDSSKNIISVPTLGNMNKGENGFLITTSSGYYKRVYSDYGFELLDNGNSANLKQFVFANNTNSDMIIAITSNQATINTLTLFSSHDIEVLDNGILSSGTTSNRPAFTSSSSSIYVGFEYFDTTLNKPIYWNGSAWVDATGTPV